MKSATYVQTFEKFAKPALMKLGFQEVHLRNCMHPEILYRNGDLWFGTSWDWRDRILDVNLGQLHWFKDVMPRVIVLGNYSSYDHGVDRLSMESASYLDDVASMIARTASDAVDNYNRMHEQVVASLLHQKSKFHRTFIDHLEEKVSDNELQAYKA